MSSVRSPSATAQVQVAVASADGWWFEAALQTFEFLETAFGYELRDVEAHFRGHSIFYGRPEQDFVLGFEPEIELLNAEFWVAWRVPEPNVIKVENLLAVRDPAWICVLRRDDYPDVRAWAQASMDAWADGLQQHAEDVLGGSTDSDLPWTS